MDYPGNQHYQKSLTACGDSSQPLGVLPSQDLESGLLADPCQSWGPRSLLHIFFLKLPSGHPKLITRGCYESQKVWVLLLFTQIPPCNKYMLGCSQRPAAGPWLCSTEPTTPRGPRTVFRNYTPNAGDSSQLKTQKVILYRALDLPLMSFPRQSLRHR